MDATDLIKTLKYGTLRTAATDLASQIEDYDSFYDDAANKPDARDLARQAQNIIAFGLIAKVCFGEGGMPLNDPIHKAQNGTTFEQIVDKHLPEIKECLKIDSFYGNINI